MSRKSVLFTLMLSSAFLIASGFRPLTAQFQGTLEINRYEVHPESGEKQQNNNFNLSIGSDRILLSGAENEGAINMLGAIDAHSILVRHDSEDFVFFGRRSEALVLQKHELLSMINLMENVQGTGRNQTGEFQSPPIRIDKTSTRERINGYLAQKVIMQPEGSSEIFHVWLTEELKINWGLLSEPWLTSLTLVSNLPFTDWMNEGQTPLKVDRFENGRMTDTIIMENIRERRLPDRIFRVPPGTEIITFQQLLMRRLGGR